MITSKNNMKELLTLRNEQLRLEIETHHLQDTEQDWSDLMKHGAFLDSTVQLCHFIPCKDGKPLEKLSNYKECGIQTQIACSQELEPCECMALSNYKKAYQQAKDAVIFEGWEWSKEKDSISNEFYTIYKTPSSKIILTDNETGSIVIDTYSDLAEATQGNPLKMRK